MHALVSIEKVQKILANYKVDLPKEKESEQETFIWNDSGVYSVVKQRVRDYFVSLGPKESHKADNTFWTITILEIALQLALLYWWISGRSYLAPFVAGLITTSLGFMVFHTAGHNAISKNPKVNTFWYCLYANYILGFVSDLWNVHHNYAHHCYTNIHRKDPDVANAAAFMRKSPYQTPKPQYKAQWYLAYLVLVFMPNQWFGQVIQYFISVLKGKIFGVPLVRRSEKSQKPFLIFGLIILALGTLIFIYQGMWFTLASLYLYSFGVGFLYWANVFPNHDTDMSEQSSIADVVKKGSDWGEHQIRHSSDFYLPYFLSYWTGGMNYQIEHHLFPTVHPRHYPALSKIVKEECSTRNIPYHLHSSWFEALKGNFKHLYVMSHFKLE